MFTFHFDPGHGWLEVSAASLRAVGLEPHQFTSCSYKKGSTLFLEEDCDAPKFINAWKDRFGKAPQIVEEYDSQERIRRLPHNSQGQWHPFA